MSIKNRKALSKRLYGNQAGRTRVCARFAADCPSAGWRVASLHRIANALHSAPLTAWSPAVCSASSGGRAGRQPKNIRMKIISYSLWGSEDRYILPLRENVEIAAELFPEWEIAVYVSRSTGADLKDWLRSRGVRVVECGESPDTRGAFWRFRALAVPGAEAVVFRDSDSALTPRDKAMVGHWLNSDRDFYLCRDHPFHARPIICCSWGAKGEGIRKIGGIADFDPVYSGYGDDEKFLAQEVYLKYRREFMVFAPFILYRGERNEPFPVPRESPMDYIGRVSLAHCDPGDEIMKEFWRRPAVKPRRRLLIPYTWSWRLAHRMALILRKKGVASWRDFRREARRRVSRAADAPRPLPDERK